MTPRVFMLTFILLPAALSAANAAAELEDGSTVQPDEAAAASEERALAPDESQISEISETSETSDTPDTADTPATGEIAGTKADNGLDTQAPQDLDPQADSAASPAEPEAALAADLSQEQDELAALRAQIEAFEHEQAAIILRARVRSIEQASHRYDPELIAPLTLLGDAEMQAGEYEQALDHYGRAVHIDRVSNGLHSHDQLDVVYKEAEAYRSLGDLAKANSRFEYAYEVQRRRFADGSIELLEPTQRLANWYMSVNNILPARTLYNYSLNLLEADGRGEHPDAIPTLEKIAYTHRLERFPPYYIHPNSTGVSTDGYRSPEAGEALASGLDAPVRTVNSFPRGERALNRIVKIRQADPNTPPEELAQAFLDLADWNLMFGYPRRSAPLYAHAYQLIADSGADAEARFAEPKLLHFPIPNGPKPPSPQRRGEALKGHVKLEFTVSRLGEIQSLKTVEAIPDDRMVFRTRRSMRVARYRPKLVAGEPAVAALHEYVHEYTYFEEEPAPEAAPAQQTAEVQDDTDQP